MAPHLHLLSLGVPLLLTDAGEQIRFRTRKHFALLIRLAVEGGRKFTRDYLMDLFWPDVPAARARHSLAQALTVVKEKVGREHLVVQRTSIALVPGVVDADVRRLDSCEAEIRGPFLDGFEVPGAVQFEQWKDEWRARLMPRIRDCLVKQMDAGRRTGDFATVERHAQVLLDLDPLSEDAVRGLIEARAWVGDRTNALKAFGRFEARLAEELGAKPSADLVRIADLLREGRRRAPQPAGQVSERCERRFEAETLIGREREFSQLYDAWLDVRRGAPRIVVLVGDPGVGKTTLTNAFVSTCQMEGAAIARAQAYDAERELPFAVLAELIKQLTLQRAIGGTDPEALSELTRVSPEIFSAFPGVPKPVEWAAEVIPLRLADGFLKAVEAGTEESPLVLVVDDIHAADNASAAILHIIARKLPHTRLLLILTARSNELRTVAAPSALASDSSIEAMRTLELEPFPATAAEQLVAALVTKAGGRVADVPVPRILLAGNGNPLALELLTKEWLAHGSSSLLSDLEALNTQPVANIGIPRAIGAVFDRQIRRLDAATRAALDLAAVLGRRLADLPLYEVVELSPAAAGEA
ncbi:MAG TPA: AAA family ATPase, partial [Gemmatimonadales bacterium]|nr:AAA family ATPase [Gemmatimonadales bacterium]